MSRAEEAEKRLLWLLQNMNYAELVAVVGRPVATLGEAVDAVGAAMSAGRVTKTALGSGCGYQPIATDSGTPNPPPRNPNGGDAEQDLEREILTLSAQLNDLEIKAGAMNLVLAVVSAKAGIDTAALVEMLKEAEEELRAKRWLS